MSDELILNVSFDNQTVTDATENWTLSGTPNVTYEQISGGSGYSLVTGRLGTPPTLVAVDQEAIYNEYTIDFNLYIKPSYTDTGWFSLFSLDAGMNYSGDYRARVYNGLVISLTVGGSSSVVTIDSPTSRWIHITIISEYDSDTGDYTAYLYVDSVLRTYKQGTRLDGSPFAIGKKLVLFNRGGSSFYLPNTPGLAIDNLTVIAGIHVPNQTPAISLPNLSRVFQNFCTWLSSQLSAVAKSGSYNDLSDKPTISTVNDGTLTIQKNGTNVATFTANQSTAATANITVPTAVSELTNDSGYLTSSSNLDASKLTSGTVDIARLPQGALERLVKVANEAARYALTTADVQLGDTVQQLDTGIMYVVTDIDHLDSAAGYTEYTAGTAASVPWSGVTGKPTFAAVATSGAYSDLTGTPALAAVATSGAYSDLTGTPTIPTVNNATLTIQKNGANVQTFTANQSTNATANITVPTKTSDLNNDSGFITSDNTKIPLAGTNALAGSIVPDTDNAYNLGDSTYGFASFYVNKLYLKGSTIFNVVDDNYICVGGGTNSAKGAAIWLNGKDLTTGAGFIFITANDETQSNGFQIRPNGDTILTNCLVFYSSADNSTDVGAPAYRYKVIYATTGTINTSDARFKNSVKDIDDKLLDAWENIEPKQYKFNDATEKKGEKARYHTGYIAQNIQQACEENGVNPNDYGLFCFDEWEAQEERKDENGQVIEPYRPKGDAYSLRYEEALIVECAYLRKCIKELRSEIEELKSSK